MIVSMAVEATAARSARKKVSSVSIRSAVLFAFPFAEVMRALLSGHPQDVVRQEIDQLDAGEGRDEPSEAVDEQIPAQDHDGGRGPELHTPQRQRDQRDDDERVEDDGAQDRALGTA